MAVMWCLDELPRLEAAFSLPQPWSWSRPLLSQSWPRSPLTCLGLAAASRYYEKAIRIMLIKWDLDGNKIYDYTSTRTISVLMNIQTSLPARSTLHCVHCLAGYLAYLRLLLLWNAVFSHTVQEFETTYWNCIPMHVHYVGSIKFYKLVKLSNPKYIFIST